MCRYVVSDSYLLITADALPHRMPLDAMSETELLVTPS